MITQAQKDALVSAINGLVTRLIAASGKSVESLAIDSDTGQLIVTYSDATTDTLGVVRGQDGVDVIDVELYEDPLDNRNVFFQTTLSSGLVLRTQNSISGYHGKSISTAAIENNQFIFGLDDAEGTTLPPIPVTGLQAVSVVGVDVRDEGQGPELFWQLSNNTELASGIVEDLRGRSVETVYKENGKIYVTYSNAPGTPVEVGSAVGIASISIVGGQLEVVLDDNIAPVQLGAVVSITGGSIVGGELVFTTNQPAPNDVINVGPVTDLKGDPGVGIQSIEIVNNDFIVTLTDATVLPPLPVSGLTPISVTGARFDEVEDELYLQLSNASEIPTGLSTTLRGRGIVEASVGPAGELYFRYSDAPTTDVQVGLVPSIVATDITDGMLRVYYSTAPTTPVDVGLVLSLVGLVQESNGRVTATYSDGSTAEVGTMRSITSTSIVAGMLRVNYNDGSSQQVGEIIGPKGDDGVGISSAYVNAGGDLILVKTDSSEHNAGFVRTTVQNLIGQSYNVSPTVGQTVFPFAHEGSVLFFVDGVLIPDASLNLDVAEEITYNGTALTGSEVVKIIVYSATGPSPTGRGVFTVELLNGSETAYVITLEDNSQFTIETNTPINIADLPAGISNVVVLPNGDLQVTLTDNRIINAGATSNAINTESAYIDGNGKLHIVLTDGTDLDVGSVVSNLAITDAEIVAGELILTFTGGGQMNAGPTGVYVTGADINAQDELLITLSNNNVINAGTVRNPLLGSIYDFICFEGQIEFPVVHDGFEVMVYANGVALSEAAIDLTGTYVKLSAARSSTDIIRIVLLSAGSIQAAGIQGQNEAPNESYYGKDSAGAVGFHPLALTKYAQPYNFVADPAQTTFAVPHTGINSFEVVIDGAVKHNGYTAPTGNVVLDTPLTGGELVRINLLKAPIANGDLIIGNYGRVAYDVYSFGGSFNKDAWRIRSVNKVVEDSIGLTIDTNRIILPAGQYYVRGHAACIGVKQNVLRLYNSTEGDVALMGSPVFAAQLSTIRNQTPECFTPIEGYFTLAVQSALVLQHKCVYTVAGFGFGRGTAGGLDAGEENNALGIPGRLVDLQFWKVG